MPALYETYSRSARPFCTQYTAGLVTDRYMSERHERLRQAREQKNIAGPKEAAVAYGWNANTYSSNENGNAPFSFRAAQRYAMAFGVRAEWLYSGEGPMFPAPKARPEDTQKVPIISWVSAGRLAEVPDEIPSDEDNWTLLSGLPRSRYFATLVQGDSMDRISPDGSIIIVDANDTDPRPGRAYVFAVNGETTYKVFQSDPVIRLEPFSTNPSNKAIYPGDRDWAVAGRVVRTFLDLP